MCRWAQLTLLGVLVCGCASNPPPPHPTTSPPQLAVSSTASAASSAPTSTSPPKSSAVTVRIEGLERALDRTRPAICPASPALDPSRAVLLHTEPKLVWRTQSVIRGTEGKRAQSYDHCYYTQESLSDRTRWAFAGKGIGGPMEAVVGVVDGDTVVFARYASSGAEIVLATPGGPASAFRFLTSEPDTQTRVLRAWDDLLLMQNRRRGGQGGPLYLLAWTRSPLALGEVEKLSARNLPIPPRDTVCRVGSVFAWFDESLHVLDRRSGTRRAYPIGRVKSWMPSLELCSENFALFRGASIKAEVTQPAFRLSTGANLPARYQGEPVAVHGMTAYVATGSHSTRWKLVAIELDKEKSSTKLGKIDMRAPVIRSKDTLIVWDGAKWQHHRWR